MLKIKNLSKHFGTKHILDDISLDIKRGSLHVLLGSSGVGKSTLLRVLCGLDIPDVGTIELDGIVIDPKTVAHTHTFGMVFQHYNLFKHLSVLSNISLPLQKVLGFQKLTADHLALELLNKYQLADKASASIASLSGGQKQRLAIARTLAPSPQVICMDEPTSALDPQLTVYIARIMQELVTEGYTVIVATHDTLLFEKLPCTIHLMQCGRIIETVTSVDYFENPTSHQALDNFVKGNNPL